MILCAFPHHATELQQYAKYILQFFRAFPVSHSKVINLDKVICRYAGEIKHIKLSKFGQFRHLEARYLQDDGTSDCNSLIKEKEIIRTDRKSNDACHQWNSGICNR